MKSPLKNNIPICFNNSDTWEVLIGTDKINYDGFLNAASFQSLEEIEQMISCPEYKNISIKLSHNYLWLILMRQKSISFVTKCVAKLILLEVIMCCKPQLVECLLLNHWDTQSTEFTLKHHPSIIPLINYHLN